MDIHAEELASWRQELQQKTTVLSAAPLAVRSDKQAVLIALAYDGRTLKYACPALCDDQDVVMAAVTNDDYALRYASARLRGQRRIVEKAVSVDGFALQFASDELRNDIDIVEQAITDSKWDVGYVSTEIRNQREFAHKTIKRFPRSLDDFPRYWSDRELVLLAAKAGAWITIADPILRNDPTFVDEIIAQWSEGKYYELIRQWPELARRDHLFKLAVAETPHALVYGSPAQRSDQSFIASFDGPDSYCVAFLPRQQLNDRHVWQRLLENGDETGYQLKWAGAAVRADKPLVLRALSQGASLQYVDPILCRDLDVARAAVTADGDNLRWLEPALQGDKELVLQAARSRGEALMWASTELQADREVVYAALSNDPQALTHAAPTFRSDKSLLLSSFGPIECDNGSGTVQYETGNLLELAPSLLQQLDSVLQDDVDIVSSAVRQDGECLQYASDALRDNKAIALQAVAQYGLALRHASKTLRDDAELVREAITSDHRSLLYASERLRHSDDLIALSLSIEAQKLANKAYRGHAYVSSQELDRQYFEWIEYGKAKEKMPVTVTRDNPLWCKAHSSQELNAEVTVGDKQDALLLVDTLANGPGFNYDPLPELLEQNEYLMDYLLARQPQLIRNASKVIQSNRALVKTSLTGGFEAFEYAAEALRNDPDLIALSSDYGGIEFMDPDIAQRTGYAKKAMTTYCGAAEFCQPMLEKEPGFVWSICLDAGEDFQWFPQPLKHDRQLCFMLLCGHGLDGSGFAHIPEALRDDEELCWLSILCDGKNLQWASADRRDDRDLVMCAVQKDGAAFQYASERLQSDRNIALRALQNTVEAAAWIPEGLMATGDFRRLVAVHRKNPED